MNEGGGGKRRSYLAAAFAARPFGMPVPPHLFGVAAFGLLGAALSPGFWLIGAGVELAYLWAVSRNPRFRAHVDGLAAAGGATEAWERERAGALARLDPAARRQQEELEDRCAEVLEALRASPGSDLQAESLSQLAWLHLRLLVARSALARVVEEARRDAPELARQADRLAARLKDPGLDRALRRSLEDQAAVIRQRQAAHAQAVPRLERADAELSRISHQVALVRDQILLAAGDDGAGRAVDGLAATLDQAGEWMREEQELLGGLDLTTAPPPERLLARRQAGAGVRT
ncbi:MAG: hypothetical protein U0229_16315 [Anaeromyxobacter sp.]